MEKAKEATARIVIFRELGIMNSFTLECSFYGPARPDALAYRRTLAPRSYLPEPSPKD